MLIHMLHRQMFGTSGSASVQLRVKAKQLTLMDLAAPRRVGRALSFRISLCVQCDSKYTSACGNALAKPTSEHSKQLLPIYRPQHSHTHCH